MGKVIGINNMMIIAENGPIKFIIVESNINGDNVQFKKSAYYPITSKGEVINKPINKGTYVMIQVMNKKIVKNKTKIIVFGRLEYVVTDDNIKDAIREQYESNEKVDAADLVNPKRNKETSGHEEDTPESESSKDIDNNGDDDNDD